MYFLPVRGGSNDGYLPSKAALRHVSLASDRVGHKAPVQAPQHHLRIEEGDMFHKNNDDDKTTRKHDG